jgi:hypothetical protein
MQWRINGVVMQVKLKLKTCKACKQKFMPVKPLQHVCDWKCAIDYNLASKEKNNRLNALKSRKETKVKLEKLKTRQEHLKDAQRFFNQYIRCRDESLPCISCGRFHEGQYHAGHYRSVGSSPHLRFEELNVHKQCSVCNNYLSSNAINFRINLIRKIGVEKVDWIESNNEPKHYTIEEIKAIKTKYKQLTKELKERNQHAG